MIPETAPHPTRWKRTLALGILVCAGLRAPTTWAGFEQAGSSSVTFDARVAVAIHVSGTGSGVTVREAGTAPARHPCKLSVCVEEDVELAVTFSVEDV